MPKKRSASFAGRGELQWYYSTDIFVLEPIAVIEDDAISIREQL
jgi:hypothetical protein